MSVNWELLDMRARIRLIDTQLVILLARRFEIMREVRAWKQAEMLPLVDSRREHDVLEHCMDLGRSLGVPDSIIRNLYSELFEHVRGPGPHADLMDIKVSRSDKTENDKQAPESPVNIPGRGNCDD